MLHDLLPTNITPKGFGRIAVQTARQTMLQKLLDAEKEMLYDEFKDRAGDLVTGTIRRFERGIFCGPRQIRRRHDLPRTRAE